MQVRRCGVCQAEEDRGKFEGEYEADTEGDSAAWTWVFERGTILFIAGQIGTPSISLDAYTAIPYCDVCGQEIREDHSLASDTPLMAYQA